MTQQQLILGKPQQSHYPVSLRGQFSSPHFCHSRVLAILLLSYPLNISQSMFGGWENDGDIWSWEVMGLVLLTEMAMVLAQF